MKLSLMLFFAMGTVGHAQYNVDVKMGEYADPQTVESNVDIGKDEIITVGTLTVNELGGTHKDVVLTRLDKEGKVIWNIRYGEGDYNEVGNGVTLSWDKKHVIVVGSIRKNDGIIVEPPVKRLALVLKIRISDGAVVWDTWHGVGGNDDQAFLVKRNNDFEDKSYVVVGTSSGDPDQSNERMYAFKIKDSGDEIWSNRYYLSDNLPVGAIHPTSMVEDKDGQFLIAGTRHEINGATTLFTIGIKTIDGNVSKDLFYYPTDHIKYVKNCDVDRHPDGKGYALTFTALDFAGDCVIAGPSVDTDRIGIIRLNEDRKVLWANVYWEKKATGHDGLSVRFYKDELQVCVNINRKENYNTSALLRVKESNGAVIFCNTYHIPTSLTDYGPVANHMIRSNDDKQYYIKSIYEKWGFSMVNPDVAGKAYCDKETKIYACEYKTEPKDEKCEAKKYGKYKFYEIPSKKVDYGERPCKDGLAPESPTGNNTEGSQALPMNKALIYPSPIGDNQEVLNLRFITDLDETPGNIRVFNSMGQEVVNYDMMFITGENQFEFDATQFTSGIYVVAISTPTGILDRVKFVKN